MEERELEIIPQNRSLALPEMDVETAMERFKQLGQFVKNIMRPNTDFGVIPGTPKPTLLKPGAEKLCTFFGLTKEEVILDREMDWTGKDHGGEPFFYFHYQIRLFRSGRLIAEADGSANSWETKHRYRQGEYKCPNCGKETIRRGKEDKGGGWYCWSKLGGCGATFNKGNTSVAGQDVGKKKNPDPADLVNTIQKMAYKRALVAATLVAVNASEYFTQDIEDLPDFTPEEPIAGETKGADKKASSRASGGSPGGIAAKAEPPEPISEGTVADINALASETGTPIIKILEAYKVDALASLTAEQAAKVTARLVAKRDEV
jgi:predicted RNA-binding Zn-ribbon protein involved in translation (DUF1610 family)